MLTITPTKFRDKLYEMIIKVNTDHVPIQIISNKSDNDAVLISKRDWDSIQETLYLQSTGAATEIIRRENENDFIPIEDIDWDTL